MELYYNSSGIHKACTSEKLMTKKWGARTARLLKQRLTELEVAAVNLLDMRHIPAARCHELKGDRTGQLAVDLDHPRRLVFRPNHDPVPTKSDGGLDWAGVTSIVILDVVDYHGD